MARALFVGNLTIDIVNGRSRVGGPGFYGGIALSEYLGVETHVLTSTNDIYSPMFRSVLSMYGIKLHEIRCNSVTSFEISAKGLKVISEGCRIDGTYIDSVLSLVRANILLLTPVLNEVGIQDAVTILSEFRGTKAIDIQGFTRSSRYGVVQCRWPEGLESAMGLANIVHGNIREFCLDSIDAVEWLKMFTKEHPDVVVLASLDEQGCYVAIEGAIYTVPAPPANTIDDIGAGDILTAVTTYYIDQGLDPLEATCRGVAAATLKVENAYSTWFDRESIESIARELRSLVKQVK